MIILSRQDQTIHTKCAKMHNWVLQLGILFFEQLKFSNVGIEMSITIS